MRDPSLTQIVARVAFAGTYLGLAIGHLPLFRVDRTGVAIIGAALMVVPGVIPWDRAVAAVDVHTLALLFGMMIVTAYLRLSGFFSLVTVWTVRLAHTPVSLLAAVVWVSGILSALFVNDIVCLYTLLTRRVKPEKVTARSTGNCSCSSPGSSWSSAAWRPPGSPTGSSRGRKP